MLSTNFFQLLITVLIRLLFKLTLYTNGSQPFYFTGEPLNQQKF